MFGVVASATPWVSSVAPAAATVTTSVFPSNFTLATCARARARVTGAVGGHIDGGVENLTCHRASPRCHKLRDGHAGRHRGDLALVQRRITDLVEHHPIAGRGQ